MSQKQAVYDVMDELLCGRDLARIGSFVTNRGVDKLLNLEGPSDAEKLSSCTSYFWERVLPNYPTTAEEAQARFPGLADLLVAYFRLAKRADLIAQASEFLRVISGHIRVKALLAINVVWLAPPPDRVLVPGESVASFAELIRAVESASDSPIRLPNVLLRTVADIAEKGPIPDRDTAIWLLRRAQAR
jgi:hypothetical protein